jgi:hypothetical protein
MTIDTEDRALRSSLDDMAKVVGSQRQTISELRAEIAKLRTPEWFYNAEDGEYTYGDVNDVVDDMGHEGVMRVGGAREVWKKWAAVRCVSVDDEGEVEDTEVETFDTEAEALRCWPESFALAKSNTGETK